MGDRDAQPTYGPLALTLADKRLSDSLSGSETVSAREVLSRKVGVHIVPPIEGASLGIALEYIIRGLASPAQVLGPHPWFLAMGEAASKLSGRVP